MIKTIKPNLGGQVLFALFLFYSLFRPPFVGFDTTIIIMLVDSIIIVGYIINNRVFRIEKNQIISLSYFLPFFVYFVVVQLLHIIGDSVNRNIYLDALTGMLKIWMYIILTVLAISIIIQSIGIDYSGYVKTLAIAFSVELLCVLAAFVSPQIKKVFLSLIYTNSHSDTIIAATQSDSYYRCYGLADNLFDSIGYLSALCIVILLTYGILNKQKIITLTSGLLLIIPLLNTRTGFILAITGSLLVFVLNFEIKKVFKYLLIMTAIILTGIYIYNRLPIEIVNWIDVGLNATVGLAHGEKTSAYSEIFGADLVWPSSIVLGNGASPEALGLYSGIDSGYVQCLWRFGLIGTLLLLFGFMKLFFSGSIGLNSRYKYMFPVFVILLLYLFKLYGIFNLGSVPMVFMVPLLLRKVNL